MPYIICDIHGGAVAAQGCRHVSECIGARQPPGSTTFVDLDDFFFCGWICDNCLSTANDNGLQEYLIRKKAFDDYPPEHEIKPLVDLLDLLPMCEKCFAELSGQASNPL